MDRKRLALVLLCGSLWGEVGPYDTFPRPLPSADPEILAGLAGSGQLGCGAGSATLRTHDGEQQVRVHRDMRILFGPLIDADDLVRRIEEQLVPEDRELGAWDDVGRREYEAILGARVLTEVRDPRALDLLVRLLSGPDPRLRRHAAYNLARLDDERTGPVLARTLRNRPEPDEALVHAFHLMADKRSLDVLVETAAGRNLSRRWEALVWITKAPHTVAQAQERTRNSAEAMQAWWRESRRGFLGSLADESW